GVVQQLDTPNNLYQQPANVFVAGFIGTPSMNFLHAGIDGDRASGDGYTLCLDNVRREATAGRSNIQVGVRPEHLHLRTGDAAECEFTGSVEVVEPLGAFTMIQ